MKTVKPKLLSVLLGLSIASVAVGKEFTMDEIEEAKAYAAEREKPLMFVKGYL